MKLLKIIWFEKCLWNPSKGKYFELWQMKGEQLETINRIKKGKTSHVTYEYLETSRKA